jgi:hypothetical protein
VGCGHNILAFEQMPSKQRSVITRGMSEEWRTDDISDGVDGGCGGFELI